MVGIVTVARIGELRSAPPLIEDSPTTKVSANSGLGSSVIVISRGMELTPSAIVSLPWRELTSSKDAVVSVMTQETVT